MSIGLAIATLLLFALGIAVRFAGSGQILNFVDYARIADRPGLHAWAGTRLLALSAATGLLAVVAHLLPDAAIFILIAFIVTVTVGVSWLAAGSFRFDGRR
jgi:hypothetical protein